MVLEHDLALRVDGEADVEEAVREGFVARLGLAHDEHVPLPGEIAQKTRLGARNIDRRLAGVGDVIEIEHLVGKALERPFRHGDQPHRQVEAREPGGGGDHVGDVLEIALDLGPLADAANGRDHANGRVRLNHAFPPALDEMIGRGACKARRRRRIFGQAGGGASRGISRAVFNRRRGRRGGEAGVMGVLKQVSPASPILRHMALNVMQKDVAKGPLRGKFKRAGWEEAYLARLLTLF